ncbi:MAG: histidine kinase [Ignavibacteriales bacterium]|nr:histidine kinase [Ignavibacteriales bacterium]
MKTCGLILLFWCQLIVAQKAIVTILVEPHVSVRDSSLHIYVAGNKPQTGLWNPSAVELGKQHDSLWKFEAAFDSGDVLEFKITRGSWESEAIYEAGIIPANTTIEITKDTTVLLRPLLWKSQLRRAKPEQTIRGNVEYHRALAGEGLNHKRDIIVWLPPSYEKNTSKHYPVLYMHDGQNIFDPSTAFTGHDWRVDEVADSLIKMKRIEEIIVVGIYNSPDRLPEYSDSPLGNAYLNFVVAVVKPLIDSTYRTKPDRKHTAVMGSSLGGLSSLFFVWKRPDIFGMAGCLSSAFWYDGEKTLKEVRDYKGIKKDIRVYLDCGGREKELIGGYNRMVDILKKKGFVKGKDLDYHLERNGVHNEQAWAKRIWRPLVFMFGKK